MKKFLFIVSFIFLTITFTSCKKENIDSVISINSLNYPNFLTPYSYKEEALNQNTYQILVNTNHYLSEKFEPNDLVSVKEYTIKYIKRPNENIKLRKAVLDSYQLMYDDMTALGLEIYIYSGYRSYEKQRLVYNITENKNEVAYPGFSEHQTALAIDISTIKDGLSYYFSQTDEFKWLMNNSYKYGFILRYPENKSHITGYSFECWHFRYVGSIANDIKNQITLEEYLYNNYNLGS